MEGGNTQRWLWLSERFIHLGEWAVERDERSGAEQRNHRRAFISAHFAAKSAVKTAGWESLCISCHIMAVTFQRNYLASQIFISRVHVNT